MEIDFAKFPELAQGSMRLDLSSEDSMEIHKIMQNMPVTGTLELQYTTSDVQTKRVIEETPEQAVRTMNFYFFHLQHTQIDNQSNDEMDLNLTPNLNSPKHKRRRIIGKVLDYKVSKVCIIGTYSRIKIFKAIYRN